MLSMQHSWEPGDSACSSANSLYNQARPQSRMVCFLALVQGTVNRHSAHIQRWVHGWFYPDCGTQNNATQRYSHWIPRTYYVLWQRRLCRCDWLKLLRWRNDIELPRCAQYNHKSVLRGKGEAVDLASKGTVKEKLSSEWGRKGQEHSFQEPRNTWVLPWKVKKFPSHPYCAFLVPRHGRHCICVILNLCVCFSNDGKGPHKLF